MHQRYSGARSLALGMALTSTMYTFDVALSDVDRGVYEQLAIKAACHPSETEEYFVTRLLAYCLEYAEGIELTEGVAAGDLPAVLIRDLTGRVTAWIEVGSPDAQRLHRGSKLAGRAAVYTHRTTALLLAELGGRKIHRASEIPVYEFGRGFIDSVAAAMPRRADVSVSITERQLYLDLSGQGFSTAVVEHRIG